MTKVVPSPENAPAIAASLARYGFYVFPVEVTEYVDPTDGQIRRRKSPRTPAFSKDATDDQGTIFDWWQARPTDWPAILVGKSQVIALDIDIDDYKDGRESLKAHGLKPPKTLSYKTLGGGKHYIYRAPDGDWTNAQELQHDGERMLGVDVRGGNGFIVYYGPELTEEPGLTIAPKWTRLSRKFIAEHDLDLTRWLDALVGGPMALRVEAVLEKVKPSGMSHDDLLVVTGRLAEYGAQGATGVRGAIEKARAIYTQGWPEYRQHFDAAILGSANYWGAPPPDLDIDVEMPTPKGKKAKKAAEKARKKKHSRSGSQLVADRPEDLLDITVRDERATDPEDFFEKATGLQARRLAHEVQLGDIARGIDGNPWVYDGGVWRPGDRILLARTIALLGDRYRREHGGLVREVVLNLPTTPTLTMDPLNEYINLENGMYRWRTGEILPHDPGYLSMVRVPITLDHRAECPSFDAWLDEVVPPDDQTLVWELIAYSLMSGNPQQKACMLVGPGGTGKGTLLRVIEHMIGVGNASHLSPLEMAGKFEPAQMYGKLANINGDLDGAYLPDTSAFKKVTGGDVITVQNKGQQPFDFRPWCFPIFATNSISRSSDATSGYFRRWVVLRFDHLVDRSKPFDEDVLYRESAGIFRKAMRYLPGLMARNEFSESISSMQAKAEFETESDVVRLWLGDDEHIVSADPSDRETWAPRAWAYKVYLSWNEDTNHGRPLSRDRFYKRLDDLGYERTKMRGVPAFRGLKVDSAPFDGAQGRPSYTPPVIGRSDAMDPS